MTVRRYLLRLVTLAAFAPALLPFAHAQSKPATTPATKAVTAAAPGARVDPLDLNTATPDQFKTLPGIGDAFAKRIIDGRPYTMKNQLTQRGILPQATYDKIKDGIVAKRIAKK